MPDPPTIQSQAITASEVGVKLRPEGASPGGGSRNIDAGANAIEAASAGSPRPRSCATPPASNQLPCELHVNAVTLPPWMSTRAMDAPQSGQAACAPGAVLAVAALARRAACSSI